ncbi:S41 family peptidase [Candidatus Saccharibacteria bacterium]|nr:S41 family peptidase [Candidatus Saccharibacteria bacterium]
MRKETHSSVESTGVVAPVARARVSWRRRIMATIVVLGAFWLGLGIGSGRIHFMPGVYTANANLPARLDYSSVNDVYQALRSHYDGKLTVDQLLNGMKDGLANATKDPYTEYFTAKEAQAFDDQLNNSFSGIGAELGKNSDGNLIVVAPLDGSPAKAAGLQPKDIIAAINGESTSGMAIETAVYKIRGDVGTKVKLDIIRGEKQSTVTITRQNITIPSVTYKVLDGNIGYIRIITFSDSTSSLIEEAADSLKAKHVKGVVLDLRDNPGGLLEAAVDVSSQWLLEGTTLLQEKRGNVVTRTYEAVGDSPLQGVPTVVLVNAGSASASEITAGALHDNKAATIIGEKSFGKGVVQQLINLKDGAELKVTIASWYRPNGQNINHKGITPDKVVKLTQKDVDAGKDPQLDAAKTTLTQ